MNDRFLVTGATGFIGSNLVRKLISKKHQVSIISRKKELNWRLSDIADQIDIHECDILNPKLSEIVNRIKPTYIFHLAAYGVLPSEDDLGKMIDINLKGTANLLAAVKKNPFKLFINTGSAFEYGIKKSSMKESDRINPINDYGVIKAASTLYCQKEAIKSNLPIINFRLFTPFGYYEDKNRLIPSVVLSAIQNKPIKVSSPHFVRDFIFIDDVVEAFLTALDIQHKPGEIFNIGSGKERSIEEIVNTVLKITKSRSEVIWGAVAKQKRNIESGKVQANITKSKNSLNWQPEAEIEKTLKKTVMWFKSDKSKMLSHYA